MSEKDVEIIDKIKKILIYAQNEGIPYQVAAGYITGNIKGYKRTGVTAKDIINEGNIVKKLFEEEKLDLKKVKEFVKIKNIDINEIIDELNTGEYIGVPQKKEREEKNMVDIETRVRHVIGDLTLKGFSESQIEEIMKYGSKFIRNPDDRQLVDKILKDNGIKSHEFVKYFKTNKEKMKSIQPMYYETENENGDNPVAETSNSWDYHDDEYDEYDDYAEYEGEDLEEDGTSEEQGEQEEESEEHEEEQDDKRPKTKKESNLESKIVDLYDKIDKEKSLFKRHINQFKIRGLIAKLQREIDKQNIKEEYAIKRERLAYRRDLKEDNLLEYIAESQKYIKFIEKKLKANEEYDYESKNFMYPKSYTEKIGGIYAITRRLKESDNETARYTAEKIEEMSKVRMILTQEKNKLNAMQEKLENLDKMYNKEENRQIIEEKRLIIANNNPLKNFKNWISNAVIEIKSFLVDRKEYTALKVKEKAEIKEMEEAYRKLQEEEKNKIKEQYANQQKEVKNSKVREFQEKSGIKVPEEQLTENRSESKQVAPSGNEDKNIDLEEAAGVEPGEE